MDFLEKIWKRATGEHSAEDQGGSQQSQNRQSHPAAEMQQSGNEVLESDSGSKEIKTYRRDGINIIEEYERLNPDGTVTKTISVGDKKNGLKKFEVYKMDKSGIVRRIESANKGDMIDPEAVRTLWMSDLRKSDNLKERAENERPSINESSNSKPSVSMNLNNLNPEQRREIFNDFKERLLSYGTNKLQNILIPKLESSGTELGLTDEEKVQILESGIAKLRTRLCDGISEEKFFTEVWPRYGLTKNLENNADALSSNEVSFSLEPKNAFKNGSSEMKPVSFLIRPEYGSTSYSESAPQSRVNQNHSFVNDTWEDDKVHRYQTKEFITNEPPVDQSSRIIETIYNTLDKLQIHLKQRIANDDSANEREKKLRESGLEKTLDLLKNNFKRMNWSCGNDDQTIRHLVKKSERNSYGESADDLIDNLHTFLTFGIQHDDSLNKEDKQMKEDFFELALETLKKKLKAPQNSREEERYNRKTLDIEQTKSKEEKSKKVDLHEPVESYDFGLKALKKLFKKSADVEKVKDEFANFFKDRESSLKRKRVKDDITYEKQRKIRNDNKYEAAEEERDEPKGFPFWYKNKLIDLWSLDKTPYKTPDDKKSIIDKEKKRLHDSHSELKSRSLERKESEYSNDWSRDSNRFSQKCHPVSNTKTQSKSQQLEENKQAIEHMTSLLERMKASVFGDRGIKESKSSRDDYDRYYLQPPPPPGVDRRTYLQPPPPPGVDRTYNSSKENNSESVDYSKIMSKLRESLSQRANKEIDSIPKQVKLSSPYSYQKPPHGTTRIGNRNPETQHNTISFRIQPQEYSKTNDSSPVNNQINYTKPSDNENVMPWWFGNAAHSNSISNNITKEPLIQAEKATNSLLGGSIFNDSFFGNFLGNNVSTPQIK